MQAKAVSASAQQYLPPIRQSRVHSMHSSHTLCLAHHSHKTFRRVFPPRQLVSLQSCLLPRRDVIQDGVLGRLPHKLMGSRDYFLLILHLKYCSYFGLSGWHLHTPFSPSESSPAS